MVREHVASREGKFECRKKKIARPGRGEVVPLRLNKICENVGIFIGIGNKFMEIISDGFKFLYQSGS